jgi:hypothetical protein
LDEIATAIEPYDFSVEVYEFPDSDKETAVNTTITDSGVNTGDDKDMY